ncbi:ACT domain-containing protein [bacterium]|nr:ACT domain-containing protein [bacterium]
MLNLETIKNIAYLGPENSFSEMATDELCSQNNINCFRTPLTTIKQIVDYVAQNSNTFGVIPMENTSDGIIRESFDCLMDCPNQNIKILKEIIMPVEYCLLSRTTELYSITGLIATPRLISKCQNFINNNLPRNHNLIEKATMLEAAYELSNHNLTYASIGNKKIAQKCMLNILKENIHDDRNNKTRYILIGSNTSAPNENNKTTIAFRTNHTPGALLKILNVFLENNINLTYISSQPSKLDPSEYTFIVTFDGHIQDESMKKAINEIQPKTLFFKHLGSY